MTKYLMIDNLLYVGRAELNPASPYSLQQVSGGVKVDWGNGDIDILPGETWQESRTGHWVISGTSWTGVRSGRIQMSGQQINLISTQVYFPSNQFSTAIPLWHTNSGNPGCSASSFFVSSRNLDWWLISLIQDENGQQEGVMWGGVGRSAVKPSSVVANIAVNFCGNITVTTNTTATSTRQSSNSPDVSLLPSGCLLTINYIDGLSSTLSFPTCPDVQLTDKGLCQKVCNLANGILLKL